MMPNIPKIGFVYYKYFINAPYYNNNGGSLMPLPWGTIVQS